jgi:hypothetical protein
MPAAAGTLNPRLVRHFNFLNGPGSCPRSHGGPAVLPLPEPEAIANAICREWLTDPAAPGS